MKRKTKKSKMPFAPLPKEFKADTKKDNNMSVDDFKIHYGDVSPDEDDEGLEKWWEKDYDVDDETGEVDDFYSPAPYYKSSFKPRKEREPSGIKGSGTLVIHPKDKSTDMLKLIYEGKNYTVVNDGNIDADELYDLIEQHEKIIMLGHGTPQGLINPGRGGYIIDSYFAPVLKQKETVSIWCNSDQFFRKHGIPGFHTGMIISEVYEAKYVLGESPLTAEETLQNMIFFSKIVGKCIEMPAEQMRDYVLEHYVGDDKVTQYNRTNIIVL